MGQEITRWLIDLGDREEKVRTRAVKDIVRSRRADLSHVLKRVASKDKAPGVRYLARKGLDLLSAGINRTARKKGGNSSEVIEHINSEDPNIRNMMALEAIRFADTRLIPYLAQRLRVEDDVYVVATLVKAMGILGGRNEIEVIAPYLNHDDSRVRANAVEGLDLIAGKGHSSEIIPMLTPQLKDADHRVRINAIKAMMGSGRVDIPSMLSDMLDAPEVWVRDSAIHAICSMNNATMVPLLKKASSDSARHIRTKAEETLAEFSKKRGSQNISDSAREPASVKKSEEFSKTEPSIVVPPAVLSKNMGIYQLVSDLDHTDPNIRKKAVIALGRSADPRAVEHILRALDDESRVVRYFAKKATAQLEISTKGIVKCPNCGFLISDGAKTV